MGATTTEGNLGSGFKGIADNMHRMAWNRARGMQGNYTMAILRYTWSGNTGHLADQGTRSIQSGLDSIDVLVRDFSRDIAEQLGEQFEAGQKVFEWYPSSTDEQLLDTDYIQWDNKRWKPVRIESDSNSGLWVAICRREEED